MADASMSHEQTEAHAMDHVSEQMPIEFSDGQAGWTRPMGHSVVSHAIVVVARARALRLRQAPALR
jgi:hypothetical protein